MPISSEAMLHYTLFTVRVWFEPTFYTVNESSGTVTLVVRTNVPGGPPLGEVEFYTVDNTAICKPNMLNIEQLSVCILSLL